MEREPLPRCKHLGVLLRLHREHRFLPQIATTLETLGRGRRLSVLVQVDRPTTEVTVAAKEILTRFRSRLVKAPRPLVDSRENFMAALQWQYEQLLEFAPDIDCCTLWDDDMWLEGYALDEACLHLNNFHWHRIYARSAFLWDADDLVNDKFPPHWQDLFFKVVPGDKFHKKLMQHCTSWIANQPETRMRFRITNAGYRDADVRDRNWNRYKEAGKIDAHTLTLVKRPALVPLESALHA